MKHFGEENSARLAKLLGTTDFVNADFKEIPDDRQVEINYHKVRGDVRMIMKRVSTPYDIRLRREKILAKKLP